jgi:HSP20 family protein
MTIATRFTGSALPEMTSVARRLNRLLEDSFAGWPQPWTREDSGSVTSAWLPAVDVFEEKDAIRITAEVPGVKADDVRISLENNVLTLRGEKKQTTEERTERVHRYERCYGAFERSFTVPTTIDADHITAAYEDGVLTVSLPKVERAKPRQISVAVQKK